MVSCPRSMPALATLSPSFGGKAEQTWASTAERARVWLLRAVSRLLPPVINSLIFLDLRTAARMQARVIYIQSVLNFLVLGHLILHSLSLLLAKPWGAPITMTTAEPQFL